MLSLPINHFLRTVPGLLLFFSFFSLSLNVDSTNSKLESRLRLGQLHLYFAEQISGGVAVGGN